MPLTVVGVLFALGSLALFFIVPGLFLVKGLFPEWRVRPLERNGERLVEMAAAGFVTSLALTITVGFILGNGPGSFQVSSQDPLLQSLLLALTVLFFVAGWLRGAWSRVPPHADHGPEGSDQEARSLNDTLRALEEVSRKSRRLRHELRKLPRSAAREREQIQEELERLKGDKEALVSRREEEFRVQGP